MWMAILGDETITTFPRSPPASHPLSGFTQASESAGIFHAASVLKNRHEQLDLNTQFKKSSISSRLSVEAFPVV